MLSFIKNLRNEFLITADDAQKLSRNWKIGLIAILALYLAFAALHARLAPTGNTGYQNAPDEEAHVNYVRVLAEGRMPSKSSAVPTGQAEALCYEWHQPPLYYLTSLPLLPFGSHAIRYVSILFGFLGLIIIFRTVRVLLPDSPEAAVLATGFAGLLPGRIAITSTFNNDSLLELCFSLFLYFSVVSLRQGTTRLRTILIGISISLALLTKATALLLLPLCVVVYFLAGWSKRSWKTLLADGIIILGIVAFLTGWWFVRNGQLYGEWLPTRTFQQSFEGTAKASDFIAQLGTLGYTQLVGTWTFNSFWAVYGTTQSAKVGAPRFLPQEIYLLATIVVVIVAAGMTRLHFVRRKRFTATQLYAIWVLFATTGIVAAAFVLFTTKFFQAQGRYFYPAMLPIAVIVAIGWRAVFPEKYREVASIGLLAFLFLFSCAFLNYVYQAGN